MKRVTLSLALLLFLSIVVPAPAKAKESWIRVRSKHFVLVGDAGEKQIRRVAVRLEQFRGAFARLFGKTDLDLYAPTTVIIFKSQDSYGPFKPNPNTAGFFQSDSHVNYITLSTEVHGEQDPFTIVFHEYTHLLANSINANIPLWFDEGLAEYYSTVEFSGDQKVVLGKPIGRHISQLQQNPLLPLKTLLQVTRQSPYYNETDKQSMFYAESWALVHYLIAGKEGRWRTQLARFVSLTTANLPAEQVFHDSFGVSIENMENELRSYLMRNRYSTLTAVLETKPGVDSEMNASPIGEAEASAYLGDLLLHGNRSDSEAYIQRALRIDPTLAMAHASLGILRARQGRYQEARESLERAVATDPENFLFHYYYAFVLSRTGTTNTELVLGLTPETIATMRKELAKAIEQNPDFRESDNLLAFVDLASGTDLNEAATTLTTSLAKSPGRSDLVLLLAQVYIRQENYQAAREILDSINKNNTESRLIGKADELLSQIKAIEGALAGIHEGKDDTRIETRDAVEKPVDASPNVEETDSNDPSTYLRAALRKPAEGETQVQGTLIRVDCDDKGFTLLVRVRGDVMSLRTAGFRNLNFRSFSADAGREISCGPRMAGSNVVVTYVPPPEPRPRVAGVTKSIEFVPSDFKLTPEP